MSTADSYTNTSYGSWNNHGDKWELTLSASVMGAIGGGDSEWLDRVQATGAFDKMVAAYDAAIEAALPPDVSLCGNEFIGPAYPEDDAWKDYPQDEFGSLDIQAIVDSVDLWPIIETHDPDAV